MVRVISIFCARFKEALKQFVPVIDTQRHRDISEEDSATIVKDRVVKLLPNHGLRTLCFGFILLIGNSNGQILSEPKLDTTFTAHPSSKPPIAILPERKIVVSGTFLIGGKSVKVARLNPDGSLDTSFVPSVSEEVQNMLSLPDGKVLVQAGGVVRRLNTNGSTDETFKPIELQGGAIIGNISLGQNGNVLVTPQNNYWKRASFAVQNTAGFPTLWTTSESDAGDPQVRIYDNNGNHISQINYIVPQAPQQGANGITGYNENIVTLLDAASFSDGTLAVMVRKVEVRKTGTTSYTASTRIEVDFFKADGTPSSNSEKIVINEGWMVPLSSAYEPKGELLVNLRDELFAFYGWSEKSVIDRYFSKTGTEIKYNQPTNSYRQDLVFSQDGRTSVARRYFILGDFGSDNSFVFGHSETLSGAISLSDMSSSPVSKQPRSFIGVQRNGNAEQDRVFVYEDGAVRAYHFLNSLSLAPTSQLFEAHAVTVGKTVTIRVPAIVGATYKWQSSNDKGSSWFDLVDGSTFGGTQTASLSIFNAALALNGTRYRFVATNSVGSVTSSALTLTVNPVNFPNPDSIAVAANGRVLVGDTSTHLIKQITTDGAVTDFAGGAGMAGFADGLGAAARFNQPAGLVLSLDNSLVVTEKANGTIRRIADNGSVTTLAGSNSERGNADGQGAAARFSAPIGVAQGPIATGSLYYIADSTNHTIRTVSPSGQVSTLAGSPGLSGATDGSRSSARFSTPTGIAVTNDGDIYVSDTTNNLIRKVNPNGTVTTIAGLAGVSGSSDGSGSAALFNTPTGLATDGTNIFVADTGNSVIRRVTPSGNVTTVVGLPTVGGFADGQPLEAMLNQPRGLARLGDVLYIADTGNAAIRKFSSNRLTTLITSQSAPTITSQPVSVSASIGSSVSFAVVVAGEGALSFQWSRGGTPINGATSSTLTLGQIAATDAGSYTVRVSNSAGSVVSNEAMLSITNTGSGSGAVGPTSGTGGGGGGGSLSLWATIAIAIVAVLRSRHWFRQNHLD